MIKRKLLSAIRDHLRQKEITIIVGPRQAGKTTVMKVLQQEIEREGKKTLFLNLDLESDQPHLASQSSLLRKIELEFGKQKGFVFIDEIQRKENASLFLKGLYDMNLPYHFVVSGSGSMDLKEKIHESLAGRKRIFELLTLSFEEFVQYKTRYAYEDRLEIFFRTEQEKSLQLLEEYLSFGGYPKIVLEESLSEKMALMNEIFRSYIERDVDHLLRIRKSDDFSRLVKLMASQIGQLTNVAELSRTLGLSQPTIKEYLWILEKTFIIHRVTPSFTNVRKEITKSPLYYFSDLGFRNFALGLFGGVEDSAKKGFLFQNFVYRILHQEFVHDPSQIHFWRTKHGSEVDFVVSHGNKLLPIEVKYSLMRKPEVNRSLRSFLEDMKPKKAIIVNLSGKKTKVKRGKSEVVLWPYFSPLQF